MKKWFTALAAFALVTTLLVGCGNKQKDIDVKALVDEMVKQEIVVMPLPVDDAAAKDVYHLNLADVEEYGIAETGRSPGVGLIYIVQAKDGKVEAVKASADKYLKDKIAGSFYPMEKEVAEKAKVEVEGNYVKLFILDDEYLKKANDMFNQALK